MCGMGRPPALLSSALPHLPAQPAHHPTHPAHLITSTRGGMAFPPHSSCSPHPAHIPVRLNPLWHVRGLLPRTAGSACCWMRRTSGCRSTSSGMGPATLVRVCVCVCVCMCARACVLCCAYVCVGVGVLVPTRFVLVPYLFFCCHILFIAPLLTFCTLLPPPSPPFHTHTRPINPPTPSPTPCRPVLRVPQHGLPLQAALHFCRGEQPVSVWVGVCGWG